MDHYSSRLIWFIKLAEQATQHAKEQSLREFGITPAQFSALAVLSDHDGVTSAELARECRVTPQTMNSTVGRLDARGLVIRSSHPVHRSLIEIRLTQQGRDLAARADARLNALDLDLAAGLTPAELADLKSFLTRVSENAPQAVAHLLDAA